MKIRTEAWWRWFRQAQPAALAFVGVARMPQWPATSQSTEVLWVVHVYTFSE